VSQAHGEGEAIPADGGWSSGGIFLVSHFRCLRPWL
jgi:hypothetical protein